MELKVSGSVGISGRRATMRPMVSIRKSVVQRVFKQRRNRSAKSRRVHAPTAAEIKKWRLVPIGRARLSSRLWLVRSRSIPLRPKRKERIFTKSKTGHRLRQQMVDEQTGRVVDKDHKGRGYELSKGRYVEIEEEELNAVKLESTHTIEIDDFVPAEDIDERYLDKPHYIVPNGKAGADAFVVIRDAMKRKDKVALGRVVLSNREHVIALKPLGKGLLGTTLRYPYELRDEDDYFDNIPSPRVSKDMVDLASHILDKKASKFDPHKFKDKYYDPNAVNLSLHGNAVPCAWQSNVRFCDLGESWAKLGFVAPLGP